MNSQSIVGAAFLAALAVSAFAPVALAAEPVACEKMLNDLRTALKDAKLTDPDKAKVADLQGKGLERCKADDDAGADIFFADAMTILGK